MLTLLLIKAAAISADQNMAESVATLSTTVEYLFKCRSGASDLQLDPIKKHSSIKDATKQEWHPLLYLRSDRT